MYAFLIILHVLISMGLVVTVLLQSGKGGGLAGTFGGGEVETVFGSKGIASKLTRFTTIFAVAFFVSCLLLAFMSTPRQARKSAIQETLNQQQQTAAPAAVPQPTGGEQQQIQVQPQPQEAPQEQPATEPEQSQESNE